MIPKDHPRYASLITREKLVDGFEKGLVAQGRFNCAWQRRIF